MKIVADDLFEGETVKNVDRYFNGLQKRRKFVIRLKLSIVIFLLFPIFETCSPISGLSMLLCNVFQQFLLRNFKTHSSMNQVLYLH